MSDPTPTAAHPESVAATTLGGADAHTSIPQLTAGYELGDEIARGGMGVVYRGRDVALNREVALKILHDKFPLDGATARRFVEEAQITGQLQHPGIPPIHHVGNWHDGRPFLAMKLIKGRTLADILKELDGTNLVAVFEAIAHAVGYAHAHDVIHRDLKPANVMVGSFGEVQVMDWGLAKVLASAGRQSPDSADPDATRSLGTQIHTTRDEFDETQDGDILGTPAYMPPEQAIGAIDEIDKRSDVFGLGAILCAILTGRPPYIGTDAKSTRQLAARAKLDDAFAKLDACPAEPELVALCKRCLSAEKASRPADANAVANEVAELRSAAEERAKAAEVERARQETRQVEQLKRRRVLTWSAAAVTVALAGGMALSLWQLRRAQDAKQATAKQLDETRDAEKRATKLKMEAETALEDVNTRTYFAMDALERVFDAASTQLASNKGKNDILNDLLKNTTENMQRILRMAQEKNTQDITLAYCYRLVGKAELSLNKYREAREHLQKGLDITKQWMEADPARKLDHDPLDFYWESLAKANYKLGDRVNGMEYYQALLESRRRRAAADPTDKYLQTSVGQCEWSIGNDLIENDQEGAEVYFASALKTYRQYASLPKSDETDLLLFESYLSFARLLYTKKAVAFLKRGESVHALRCYQFWTDIELSLDLESLRLELHSEGVRYHLGDILILQGELAKDTGDQDLAIKSFQQWLKLPPLVGDDRAAALKDRFRTCRVLYAIAGCFTTLSDLDEAKLWAEQARVSADAIRADFPEVKPDELSDGTFSNSNSLSDVLEGIEALSALRAMAIKHIDNPAGLFNEDDDAVIPKLVGYQVKRLLNRNDPNAAIAVVDQYDKWANSLWFWKGFHRYHAARMLALCAGRATDRREELIDRIIGTLSLVRELPLGVAEARFKLNADFPGIVAHPKFVRYLATLEKPREPAPLPREAK